MKFFVESIDRKIWDAITNDSFMPMCGKDKVSSENLGPNGLRAKVKRLNLIALLKMS